MPIVLNGSTGITTPTYNGSTTAEYLVPVTGFKNRIINGDMTIDQRNAGASVTASSPVSYTLDRWKLAYDVDGKYSVQQNAGSVTPPVGFVNYLGVTSLSAYSVPSGEIYGLQHHIEGYNTADLQWGTANAKTVTLSFWVRSSLTGTFGGSFINASSNRSYPYTYTISAANTWEQKSITVVGDTSGTWNTTNGRGIVVIFSLGTGSTFSGTAGSWSGNNFQSATGATSVVGTNGATFYITGVQLEVGSNATSFDYLPYGTELALCQRYFYKVTGASGNNYGMFGTGTATGTTGVDFSVPLPVTMRSVPTFSYTGLIYTYDGIVSPTISSITAIYGGYNNIYMAAITTGGSASGRSNILYTNNASTASVSFSAEL